MGAAPDPGQRQAELERLVHGLCRAQPPRSAPPELQARVLAAVAAREARPVLRRSVPHWPPALRIAFALAALLAATVSLRLQPAGLPLGWLRDVAACIGFAGALGHLLVGSAAHAVPTAWLYAVGLQLTALYAALIGSAFLTFRTLRHRS